MQKLTDQHVTKISDLAKHKEDEIMISLNGHRATVGQTETQREIQRSIRRSFSFILSVSLWLCGKTLRHIVERISPPSTCNETPVT